MENVNKKIRVLVIDDEPFARSNLTALLKLETDIELIGECDSGQRAIAAIHSDKPDLIFLDVQMPECDGFDVLEMLGHDRPRAIIFVTAYDHHALRAFEVGALDYLLKPFDDARFHTALDRARERLRHQAQPTRSERLVVKSAGQVLFLNVADIDWIGAADYYSSVYVATRTHLLRRSLADLEQDLDPSIFIRVHRSTIINLNRLHSLELSSDGEYDAVLNTGVRLRVSRRYRKAIQERTGL
jgi:two-component system LytT family response regulator